MERGEFLTKIMEEKGYNAMSLSKASGVPYTTIRSMIERNLNNASVDNVIKICQVLEISVESLNQPKSDDVLPELNKKDERDIEKELEKIIYDLSSQNSYAAFDGQGIEEMDEEDRELLKQSLENSLRLAKRIAKQKFTPKKYKK
jgi:transcriptional regulator with XRE-family HTH domain